MIKDRLTLIAKTECKESEVTQPEAEDFLHTKDVAKPADPKNPPEEGADDLVCYANLIINLLSYRAFSKIVLKRFDSRIKKNMNDTTINDIDITCGRSNKQTI